MKFKGEIALLICAVLYGMFGVFSRIISFNIPLFFQAWSRNIVSILLIFVLLKLFSRWKKVKKSDVKWFILRSVGGFISFISLYLGFIYLDFSTNYFISYATATIAGYTFGYLFFKEKLTKVNLNALILSMLGLLLVFQVNLQAEKILYLLLSAIGGITTSVWTVFSKKISGTYSNLQMNLIDSVFAFSFPFALSIIYRETWVMPTLSWIWVANWLFGLMFLLTAFLIVYGFKYVDAQRGSLILLFDIVIGVFLGYLVFKEAISLQEIMGGLLIIAAMILPNIKFAKIR